MTGQDELLISYDPAYDMSTREIDPQALSRLAVPFWCSLQPQSRGSFVEVVRS